MLEQRLRGEQDRVPKRRRGEKKEDGQSPHSKMAAVLECGGCYDSRVCFNR